MVTHTHTHTHQHTKHRNHTAHAQKVVSPTDPSVKFRVRGCTTKQLQCLYQEVAAFGHHSFTSRPTDPIKRQGLAKKQLKWPNYELRSSCLLLYWLWKPRSALFFFFFTASAQYLSSCGDGREVHISWIASARVLSACGELLRRSFSACGELVRRSDLLRIPRNGAESSLRMWRCCAEVLLDLSGYAVGEYQLEVCNTWTH